MSDITLTWDDLRERARNHSDLSAEQSRDAVLAFDVLQSFFGKAFFDPEHTLFWFFLDRSGWRCEWAIWFAGFLQSLNQHPDFPRLVRELGNPALYGERMTILKILEILIPVGFSFSLDCPISIKGVQKKPDLFVKQDDSDPGFFIEVTTLAPSKREREATRVFHEISESVWPFLFQTDYCGHLERVLAPLHLQEVKQKVQIAAKKAAHETGFETVEIAGVIQIAFAAKSRNEELQKWADVHGMKVGEFSGLAVKVSEFDRISTKLTKELEQVPPDRANVVVIYSHFFALPPRDTHAFEKFVHALEDEVYKHSHIGYLVLIFRWTGGSENQVLRYGDHICVNRCQLYFNCDSIMLFKNRFAAKPMPPDIEEKFLKAFTQCNLS
jgi:hypothetical protein